MQYGPEPSSSIVLLFFRGGLGVGEKHTCSPEHTQSTVAFHLPMQISLRNLSGEPQHCMGLETINGPFRPGPPRCASFVCVERKSRVILDIFLSPYIKHYNRCSTT